MLKKIALKSKKKKRSDFIVNSKKNNHNTYSHGTSSILWPRGKSRVKQLAKMTQIMAIVQNGCVSIRAAVRRITLFGRNSPSAFDDENRNKSLFRLTIMNV